jgi:hypothetical protein
MNGLVRFALGMANMPQHTIDDLERSLPGFGRLCDLAKKLEPIIQRNAPHIKAIEPDVPAIVAIITKAWPDIVAVTPTVDELINFVKDDQ